MSTSPHAWIPLDAATLRANATAAFAALPSAVTDLARLFDAAGHEFALVGGPVRDAFLGRQATDLDFTTSAQPEQTEAILASWGNATWDIGRAFGTIGAIKNGVRVEVTTYRCDAYSEHSRKPVVAFGDSLTGDLARRDFTVNAMALRLPSREFVDPFGGLSHLQKGLLMTPIDPEISFSDDPLRMMRAARFVSQLGMKIAAATAEAMLKLASRIEIVSAERIRDEIVRLMLGKQVRAGLDVLVDSGLAEYVLPELPALKLEIDEHHHHKDVYEHTLTVVEQAIGLETDNDGPVPSPDFVLRFAALMHDIGKPPTRRFEPGGGVSFHHHEIVGARMTRKRMRALKFDKTTVEQVALLVSLHLRFHGYSDGGWTDSAVRRYVADAGEQLERLHRLTRADCTTRNQRRARFLSHAYDDLERRISELAAAQQLAAVRPELDGNQIQQILQVPPGPVVGRAYKFLLELRLEEGTLGIEVVEERLRQWWSAQGGSN